MIFREATQPDLDYMAEHTTSRGVQKNRPEQTCYTYTLEDNGIPLGIGGFNLINHHTAWCWVDLSPLGHENIRMAYRTIKNGIERFAEENHIRRLQAYVECDFPEAILLVRHLGFERESIMKNFVGDKDAFMYIRIL